MRYLIQNVRNQRITPTLPVLTKIGYRTAPIDINPLNRNLGLDNASAELVGSVRHRRLWLKQVVQESLFKEGVWDEQQYTQARFRDDRRFINDFSETLMP